MRVRLTGLRKATDDLNPLPQPRSFSSVSRTDSKTGRLAIDSAYPLLRYPATDFTSLMRHIHKSDTL